MPFKAPLLISAIFVDILVLILMASLGAAAGAIGSNLGRKRLSLTQPVVISDALSHDPYPRTKSNLVKYALIFGLLAGVINAILIIAIFSLFTAHLTLNFILPTPTTYTTSTSDGSNLFLFDLLTFSINLLISVIASGVAGYQASKHISRKRAGTLTGLFTGIITALIIALCNLGLLIGITFPAISQRALETMGALVEKNIQTLEPTLLLVTVIAVLVILIFTAGLGAAAGAIGGNLGRRQPLPTPSVVVSDIP
jgi:hypothetical protein